MGRKKNKNIEQTQKSVQKPQNKKNIAINVPNNNLNSKSGSDNSQSIAQHPHRSICENLGNFVLNIQIQKLNNDNMVEKSHQTLSEYSIPIQINENSGQNAENSNERNQNMQNIVIKLQKEPTTNINSLMQSRPSCSFPLEQTKRGRNISSNNNTCNRGKKTGNRGKPDTRGKAFRGRVRNHNKNIINVAKIQNELIDNAAKIDSKSNQNMVEKSHQTLSQYSIPIQINENIGQNVENNDERNQNMQNIVIKLQKEPTTKKNGLNCKKMLQSRPSCSFPLEQKKRGRVRNHNKNITNIVKTQNELIDNAAKIDSESTQNNVAICDKNNSEQGRYDIEGGIVITIQNVTNTDGMNMIEETQSHVIGKENHTILYHKNVTSNDFHGTNGGITPKFVNENPLNNGSNWQNNITNYTNDVTDQNMNLRMTHPTNYDNVNWYVASNKGQRGNQGRGKRLSHYVGTYRSRGHIKNSFGPRGRGYLNTTHSLRGRGQIGRVYQIRGRAQRSRIHGQRGRGNIARIFSHPGRGQHHPSRLYWQEGELSAERRAMDSINAVLDDFILERAKQINAQNKSELTNHKNKESGEMTIKEDNHSNVNTATVENTNTSINVGNNDSIRTIKTNIDDGDDCLNNTNIFLQNRAEEIRKNIKPKLNFDVVENYSNVNNHQNNNQTHTIDDQNVITNDQSFNSYVLNENNSLKSSNSLKMVESNATSDINIDGANISKTYNIINYIVAHEINPNFEKVKNHDLQIAEIDDATIMMSNNPLASASENQNKSLFDLDIDQNNTSHNIILNETNFETLAIRNNINDPANVDITKSSDINIKATANKILSTDISDNCSMQLKVNMNKEQQPYRKVKNPLKRQIERTNNKSETRKDNISETDVRDLEDFGTVLIPGEIDNEPEEKSIIILDDDQESSTKPKKLCVDRTTINKFKLDDLILLKSNFVIETQKHTNTDSFLTIDLTKEPGRLKKERGKPTDINVDSTDDVILVPTEDNTGVIQGQPTNTTTLSKITHSIANLNAIEKSQLLEMITKVIFNKITNQPNQPTNSPPTNQLSQQDQATCPVRCETPGSSNLYHPKRLLHQTGLRMIVIDGSNVAMGYSNGKYFSVKGLNMCIDFFRKRGHVVKVFVPKSRHTTSSNPKLLDYLEEKGYVIYTPARKINGVTVVPYDDRYIVQCAVEFDAVVVSRDRYEDLVEENPNWGSFLEARRLRFTWIEKQNIKEFTVAAYPRGWGGPTLEEFLKHPSASDI